MPHPDEGLIHAWLDGELDADERVRVELLVQNDPEWAAAAADARGVIAASSRIVAVLDHAVPSTVPREIPRRRHTARWWMLRSAATVLLVAGVGILMRWRVPGSVSITGEHGEPRAVPAEVPAPPILSESQAKVRDAPMAQRTRPPEPRTGAEATAAPQETRKAADGVAGGVTARPPQRSRVDLPPQLPATASDSALTGGRTGLARAEPSRPAPANTPAAATAVERRALERSSQAPAAIAALKDQQTPRAESASNKMGHDTATRLTGATACFAMREPRGLTTRVLRLDEAQLADSVRLGTLSLRGDTLRRAGAPELGVKVPCQRP